jgi:hypothetical protein
MKNNLKIEKKTVWICFFYLYIDGDSNFMQFRYCLIVHQRSLNYNYCKLYKILMVLNRVSNNNEIA